MSFQAPDTRKGDPKLMGQINQALILNLLRNGNGLSRTQIAQKLKLSKATVSRVVNGLIENKIVSVIGEGESKKTGGRHPVILSTNSSGRFVVGVDLGTTNIVVGIANLKGEIIKKIRVQTNCSHSVEKIILQISNLVEEVIKQANIKKNLIEGIGIAEAGIVDSSSGIIKYSPNFNWKNVNIASILEKKTGLHVFADNCTRVMAIGEIWHGKRESVNNIFYVNVGYGIGSALMINGKLYNKHSEFGHIPITSKKILCNCGKYGCLEAVASGNAIERKANQLYNDSKNRWITAKDIAERAEQGDPVAHKIFKEAGYYIGKGLSFVENVFNPDKIIIGGGISAAGKLLLDPIVESYNNFTMAIIKSTTKIELSTIGMDAGIYGAVTMVLNKRIFYTSLL